MKMHGMRWSCAVQDSPVLKHSHQDLPFIVVTDASDYAVGASLVQRDAPVLFVPKKRDPVTGERTWRMCISYVKLNSKTLNRIAYHLPRIADLLARVSNAQYFSKLDLLSGFYQVRMRDTDIPKTGFTTPCVEISSYANGLVWCSGHIPNAHG